MRRALVLLGLVLGALGGGRARTTAAADDVVMTYTGTVFSVTREEYAFKAGKALIQIKKTALSAELRKSLDGAGAHEITIEIPREAIVRIRSAGTESKSK